MAEPVEPRRRYHSPRREAQAAATRTVILEAAGRLFAEHGYPATTMGAIAAEAGVALKTVYVAFETKGGVLRALWNRTLRDGDDVPVAEQDWYRETLGEPDPERQLRLNARNSTRGKVRVGGVGQVIRAAAPSDPEIGALWDRIQTDYRANQRAIVESIHAKGALRDGLDVERATDILWTINNPDVWHLLAGLRGWTPEAYERWSGDTAVAQLLR